MKYEMNLGHLRTAGRVGAAAPTGRFRLAILADLSGRANKGEVEVGEALAARRPLKADVDNLDSLVSRLELVLNLPIGTEGSTVGLRISCMDDFHPDDFFDNLDVFSELSALRRRLKNGSTFAAAAEDVRSWAPALEAASIPVKSAGTTIPRGKLSDFAQLIGKQPTATPVEAATEQLLSRFVSPYIVPAAAPEQDAYVAAVDQALSGVMRAVLHHPDFQAAEAIWRSVDLLTRRLETGPQLEIVLYDLTAEEFAADLSSTDRLEETGLFKLLVEQPAGDAQQGPLSAIIGNFMFEQTPPHAELLGRMAKVASAAQAPFVAGMSVTSLEQTSSEDEVHPLIVETWSALRDMPASAYLGLVVPRFLLRWPYGRKTEPIDPFDFEEFTPRTGLKGMLWGNGAILAGLLMARTCQEQGMKAMRLGSIMNVDDMPFYYYTDKHGDTLALPCTERLVQERQAYQLKSAGLMPALSIKGRAEVRLGGFESLAGSLLAGPWDPVAIPESDFGPAVPVSTAASPSASEPPGAPVSEPTAEIGPTANKQPAAEALQTPSAEQEPIGVDTDATGDDETGLDALLAELEDAEQASSDAADDDIDPDLAALLEGL